MPACAQACPTASIQFGPIDELRQTGRPSASSSCTQGPERGAYLYGADEKVLGGLNAFYLLMDEPEVYGLPADPKVPRRSLWPTSLLSIGGGGRRRPAGLLSFGETVWPAGRRPGVPRRGRKAGRRCRLTPSSPLRDWHWLIIWYFFLGGIAAGAYVMAALLDLFGDEDDRPRRPARLLPRLPAVCSAGCC